MKTCIISDSHDRADALAAAIAKAQAAGAQAVIHCGDLIGANTLRAPIKLGVQIHAHGAEMIVTPRQLFQANVEVYQSEINKKKGNKLAMQVLYYSQLMKVAYGGSFKGAGLDGHVIQPAKLQRIAERKNNRYRSRPFWCERSGALIVHPQLDWQLHLGLSSHPVRFEQFQFGSIPCNI